MASSRGFRRDVPVTSSGIAYDYSSPHGGVPVLFLHAGVGTRRSYSNDDGTYDGAI